MCSLEFTLDRIQAMLLFVALPKVPGKRQHMDAAKAFHQQFVSNGVSLPASMHKALEGFIAGKGAADDPFKVGRG